MINKRACITSFYDIVLFFRFLRIRWRQFKRKRFKLCCLDGLAQSSVSIPLDFISVSVCMHFFNGTSLILNLVFGMKGSTRFLKRRVKPPLSCVSYSAFWAVDFFFGLLSLRSLSVDGEFVSSTGDANRVSLTSLIESELRKNFKLRNTDGSLLGVAGAESFFGEVDSLKKYK